MEQFLTFFFFLISFVRLVCGYNGVPESWSYNKFMDMADTLFDMGIDNALVPFHRYVQVKTISSIVTVLFLLISIALLISNIWPTIPVAAVFVGMDQILFSSPVFWLGLFIIPIATMLADVVVKV